MDEYYVFQAKPIKRARLHLASCRHCRDGQGQEGQHKTGSGATAWTGPYQSRAGALAFLLGLEYKDAKPCGYCKP